MRFANALYVSGFELYETYKPGAMYRLSSTTAALGFASNAAHGAALVQATEEFVKAGVLCEELLEMLWCDTGLLPADYNAVLQMLEQGVASFGWVFGLMLSYRTSKSDSHDFAAGLPPHLSCNFAF